MGIVLGANQYGKAEVRLVRLLRDTPRHEIHDLSVSTALRGDFAAAHGSGDQGDVLPTDTQRNTVSRSPGSSVGQIEDFALGLARHFIATVPAVTGARVQIEAYAWDRIGTGDRAAGHDHAFVRRGQDVRTTAVTVARPARPGPGWCRGSRTWSCSSRPARSSAVSTPTSTRRSPRPTTGSWPPAWWPAGGTRPRRRLGRVPRGHPGGAADAFADTRSRALQQTLQAMGTAALTAHPELAEIRFAAPNKHHFEADLTPFGLDNPGLVFYAADRPYGLIEAAVIRDDAPDAGLALIPPPA